MTRMVEFNPVGDWWTQTILTTLTNQKINASLVSRARGPQAFTMDVRLFQSQDLEKTLGLGEELALEFGVGSVRIVRRLGLIRFEVSLPKAFREMVTLRSLNRRHFPWVTLGRSSTGEMVHLNVVGNRTCHSLIAGQTGSGKTITEQVIAWSLTQDCSPNDTQVILIDGKGGIAWEPFERLIHLAHPVIVDPQDAVKVLGWVVMELENRKLEKRNNPKLFIIIDELREVLVLGGPAVTIAVERITSLGRELGIHLIAATQHPLNEAVGGALTKANFTTRIIGSVTTANAAHAAAGIPKTGAERLNGDGDFLVVAGDQVIRTQIAWIGNRELGKIPRREGVAQPFLPIVDLDPDQILDLEPSMIKEVPGADPDQVAEVLATGRGVRYLKDRFHIGSSPARRSRQFATKLEESLKNRGFKIVSKEDRTFRSFLSPIREENEKDE